MKTDTKNEKIYNICKLFTVSYFLHTISYCGTRPVCKTRNAMKKIVTTCCPLSVHKIDPIKPDKCTGNSRIKHTLSALCKN